MQQNHVPCTTQQRTQFQHEKDYKDSKNASVKPDDNPKPFTIEKQEDDTQPVNSICEHAEPILTHFEPYDEDLNYSPQVLSRIQDLATIKRHLFDMKNLCCESCQLNFKQK